MSDTTFPRTFPSERMQATDSNTPRRTTHSASGWTLPQALRQPQDGSLTQGSSAAATPVRLIDSRISSSLVEAEDARLNGSLRSLARRVKGLNVMQSNRYTVDPVVRKAPEAKRKTAAPQPQVA